MGVSSKNSQAWFSAVLKELALLAMIMLAVPLIVALDLIVFKQRVTEFSVTEFTQGGVLLLSTMWMGMSARRQPNSRGFLVLVTGLLGVMFVREYDKFLDVISKGFWIYPAIFVVAGAFIIAYRFRDTVLEPMATFTTTKSYTYLVIGLMLVLIFSRAFGTSELWGAAMGTSYNRFFKAAIQEGLELLGYALLCYGCLRNDLRGNNRQSQVAPG